MRRRMTWAQRGLRFFLGFVRVVCVLAIVVFPIAVLIPGGYTFVNVPVSIKDSGSGGEAFQCRAAADSDRYTGRWADVCEARSRVRVDRGVYEVIDEEDGLGTTLLALLPMVLAALIVLYAVTMLTRVLDSLRDGDPFIRENADRMRRAALAVGVGGFATSGLMTIVAGKVVDHPKFAGFGPAFFPAVWYALIIGVVLAVVAEVFRYGADFREDLEGVV